MWQVFTRVLLGVASGNGKNRTLAKFLAYESRSSTAVRHSQKSCFSNLCSKNAFREDLAVISHCRRLLSHKSCSKTFVFDNGPGGQIANVRCDPFSEVTPTGMICCVWPAPLSWAGCPPQPSARRIPWQARRVAPAIPGRAGRPIERAWSGGQHHRAVEHHLHRRSAWPVTPRRLPGAR